jgi:hypothetical protein
MAPYQQFGSRPDALLTPTLVSVSAPQASSVYEALTLLEPGSATSMTQVCMVSRSQGRALNS